DEIGGVTDDVDVIAARRSAARCGLPQTDRRRIDRTGRTRRVARVPVKLAAQRGSDSIAVLLETYVDGDELPGRIDDVVDLEPETAGRRIMERRADQIGIRARLQLPHVLRHVEETLPELVAPHLQRENS